jgi:Fic family protein
MLFTQTVSGNSIPIEPGALRERGIRVGRHHAPETKSEIENYLKLFQDNYTISKLPASKRVLAFASSHHRLLWIHPFPDGNGRVCRLFTLAFAERIGVDSEQLWNVSRAFARQRGEYDAHLASADMARRHDYDGRGPLSEEALNQFCKFFLKCCVDQLQYMEKILELPQLEARFSLFVQRRVEEKLISRSTAQVLRRIFQEGQISRGEVRKICHVKDRRANQIVKEVLDSGIAYSPTTYGPLRIKLATDLRTALFTDL